MRERWVALYNKTIGSSTYKEKVKPIVDKALGGSLRLFVQKVYEGSYFTRNEEVVLYANANLPRWKHVGANEYTGEKDGNVSE